MRANPTFFTLLILAGLALALLAGALFNMSMHFVVSPVVNLCGQLFALAVQYGYDFRLVGYPLLVLTFAAVGFGLRRLALCLWQTRRLIRSLTYPRLAAYPPSLVRLMERLGLDGRLDVVDSPLCLSLCYGLVRPRVCLTTGLLATLDEAELEALLVHERRHVVSSDPLKLLAATTLRSSLFFLPILQDLEQRFRQRIELEADQIALNQCGPVALAGAMVKMLHDTQMLAGHPGVAVGAMSVTNARIDQILKSEVRHSGGISRPRFLVSVLALFVLLLCSLPIARDPSLPGMTDGMSMNAYAEFSIHNSRHGGSEG